MHWECPELVAGIAHSCPVDVISKYKTSHVWLGECVSAQYAIFKWEAVYTTSEYGISKSTDYEGIIVNTLYRTLTSSAFDISSEYLQFTLVFVLVWNIGNCEMNSDNKIKILHSTEFTWLNLVFD